MATLKPLLELELRPVEAPGCGTAGACVYVLLPPLEELVGSPDFGRRNAICLPGAARPFDPWALFSGHGAEGRVLH